MFLCVSVAAQRKSDSLQDRIDALEREKDEAEQNLEEAVLQVYMAANILCYESCSLECLFLLHRVLKKKAKLQCIVSGFYVIDKQ